MGRSFGLRRIFARRASKRRGSTRGGGLGEDAPLQGIASIIVNGTLPWRAASRRRSFFEPAVFPVPPLQELGLRLRRARGVSRAAERVQEARFLFVSGD